MKSSLSLKHVLLASALVMGAVPAAFVPHAFGAGDGGGGGGGGGSGGGGGGGAGGGGGGGMGGGGMGGGSGDPTGALFFQQRRTPSTVDPTRNCAPGLVFDVRRNGCVRMRRSDVDDETLYRHGARLAVDGRYEDAIGVLSMVERRDDARVLNYLGFSHRKLGNFEAGLPYYHRAIAADPDYTLVREYLGEAYIQLGQIDLAREQLREIERRCGTTCDPYRDLAEELARHEKQASGRQG